MYSPKSFYVMVYYHALSCIILNLLTATLIKTVASPLIVLGRGSTPPIIFLKPPYPPKAGLIGIYMILYVSLFFCPPCAHNMQSVSPSLSLCKASPHIHHRG